MEWEGDPGYSDVSTIKGPFEEGYLRQESCGSLDGGGGGGGWNEIRCPPGTALCTSSQECSPDCYQDDGDDPSVDDEITCRPGFIWCLSANRCVPEEGGCGGGGQGWDWDYDDDYDDKDYDGEDEEDDENDVGVGGKTNAISCRPGLIWCLSANRCVPENGRCSGGGGRGGWDQDYDYDDEDYGDEDEEDDDENEGGAGGRPDAISCRPGSIWCLSANRCVPENRRCSGGDGGGGWDQDYDYQDEDYDDEDEEEDEDYDDGIGGRPNAISCRPGLIWCLSANRCVPEDGRCGRDGDDENDYEDDEDVMTCNPGYVWCLSASDCVPENRGCKGGREWWDDDDEEEEGDDDDGKEIRCRQGKIFCASVQVRPNGISGSGGNFRYFLDQQMTVAT